MSPARALGRAVAFVRALYVKWSKDDVPRLAAAVAFFSLLSLAPLVLLALLIAQAVSEVERVQGALVAGATQLLGGEGAEVVRTLLEHAGAVGDDPWVVALSAATLLYGAANLFLHLQRALNEIWDVSARPDRGWTGMLRDRMFAFGLVLAAEFLLVLSPLLDEALDWLQRRAVPGALSGALDRALLVGLFALLFAAVFKMLPDARVAWRDVAAGAGPAALLFALAQAVMRRVLGGLATTDVYGAAGSVVIVLLWAFVAMLILFLGAEITQVVAAVRGERVVPYDYAVTVQRERELKREAFSRLVARVRGDEPE